MKSKFNIRKFFKYLVPFALLSTVVTTVILSNELSKKNVDTPTNNLFNNSTTLENSINNRSLNDSAQQDNSKKLEKANNNSNQQKFDFYPNKSNGVLNLSRPNNIDYSNNSLWPKFEFGSNTISLNLSTNVNSSAVNFSNFSFPFAYSKMVESVPVNETTDMNNTFIGYQVYQNGSLINLNNYGSILNQSLSNSDGMNLINNVNFKNFNPLVLNANSSAIFSVSGAGVENNSLSQLGNRNLFKFIAPIQQANNFYIDDNPTYISGTKFFYNFIVFNNSETNKYEFYIPDRETTFKISFNGQEVNYDGHTSQTFTTKNKNITASQFATEIYNGNLDYTNQFNLNIYNSLNSYNGNDVKLEFVANDEIGLLNVNLVIKNYLSIENNNGKNVYNIIPEKRFDNVFSIKGFKPSKSYNLSLNFLSESTIRKNFTNQIVQIGDITNGFGIYSNYANIFAVNTNNESERYVLDWTSTNSSTNPNWQNVFANKPIKFIDLNLNENIYSPKIFEDYWTKLINFANNYSGYATISNQKDQSSIQDSKFNFSKPVNSVDNSTNQWISLSYWNSSFNNYVFSNQYNSVNPVNYGQNINISQPFYYGNNEKKYFSIFNKINTTGDNSISNDNQLVLNLRIRNDSLDLNNINGTKILNFGDSTTLFNSEIGHSYENIGFNKFYEYLTGVVCIYDNNVYWVAPSWGTYDGNKTSIFIDPNNKISDINGNTDISEITPSEYLNSKNPTFKLNLNFIGATLSTITNAKIIAYPNDIDGSIDFTIIPGIGVNSNIVSGNNSSIDNKQIREYESTQLDPIHFTVDGFKKTNVLQDTILKSSTYNVSDPLNGIFKDAYITYAIDNYLETTQTISKEVLDRKNDIIASAIINCIDNIYDPYTKKKINVTSYADIVNLISNVKLEIPQNLKNTGYNHLILSFDLNGIASGGLIANQSQHFELNIQFKLPEKVATTFNPLVALNVNNIPDKVENDVYTKGAISNKNIYDILGNVSSNSNLSSRYDLLNYLLTGYQSLQNLTSNNNIFNVTFDKFNSKNGSFETIQVKKEVLKNQFIFGYPTDFYKAYGNSYKNNDELDPINSWTLTDLILNNDSVSFNLGLKYFVNSQGIITSLNNASTNKIYGNKFKGVEINDITTTLLNPAPPGFFTTDSTVLASELLNSYKSKTELWNSIARRISQSIINAPQNLSSYELIAEQLVIIENSFSYSNLNGIATFDLGINQALINGNVYTNSITPFKLGTVSVYGFKKVKQTILKSDFNANIINVNGITNSLEILGESLTVEQLSQVILENGLLNYPNNVNVKICKKDGTTILPEEMKNYIVYDNLNGSITLDSSKVSIFVSNYIDSNGDIQSNPKNFLEGKIVINGFKTITPTSLISNEFIVDGSELIYDYLNNGKLNKEKAKQIVIRYINSVPEGFNDSNIYIDDNDVTIDMNSNTITFKVKSNYYFDSLGNLIGKQGIPADGANSYSIENNIFTISGFNVENKDKTTTTNEAGETFVNLNTYIASNYVNLSSSSEYGYNFNSDDVSRQLKAKLMEYIVNSISSGYKLIINAPNDLSVNNIDIFIDSVNNQTGVIKLKVYSNKYFNNGSLNTSADKNYLIGKIDIGGFRKLPSQTALSNNIIEISNLSNLDVDAPSVDEFYIEKIISKNVFTVFSNIPNVDQSPLINHDQPYYSKNKLDYPTFNFNPLTIDDSNVKVSITNRDKLNGEITCSISLNSYYWFDTNANTIIWENSTSHNFGDITIKGFKSENKTTSISSKLDLRSFENTQQLQSKYTTDVIKEYTNTDFNELKLFILNNAIINKPEGFSASNILINNFSSDNKNGVLNCDVIINKYYKNNVLYPQDNGYIDFNSPDALKFSISISGFKTALPTTINSIINMSGTSYANIYPSDLKPTNPDDINTIKSIILENVQNPPPGFSINNINITNWESNNKNGEIIISDVILNNYYNDTDNNNLSTTNKNFGPIKLINFKTISNATSVITNYSVNVNQLPFKWLGINPESTLINYVKNNNLILNYPSDLFSSPDTLKISNIVADNCKGQITFNLKIKDYFTANGDYIIGNLDQSNWLSKDITLIGFNTIQPTSIESELNYSIFQKDFVNSSTASSLLTAISSSEPEKQKFISLIFKNAINYKFLDLSDNDLQIDLNTAIANNIDGTLKINVTLLKYINTNGIYVDAAHNPELGLKQTIIISGFDQVKQTYISSTATSYTGPEIAQEITEQEAIKFVFDNLIINKSNNMQINDLKIKDWSKRSFNNNLGQLSFEIGMINHYYNDKGQEVTSPLTTPNEWYTVNLIVHNTVLPTTSKPIINVQQVDHPEWGKIYPSDFVNITNKTELSNFLFTKQNPDDTFTNALLNLPKDFNSNEAIIENIQDQNGIEVLGEADNINGTVKVTMLINNYYNEINAEHVNINSNTNNVQPLRLTTILEGFNKIDSNLITQIPTNIDLHQNTSIPGINDLIQSLSSNYDSKNNSNYLDSNSIISTLILNNIKQWFYKDQSGTNQAMTIEEMRKNFRINSLVSNNIDGSLVAKIQIKNFYNNNGIFQTNWSTEYSVVINGFRKIKPTTFNNANVNLSGAIGEQLANIFLKNTNIYGNYTANDQFSDINLSNIDNVLYEVISYLVYSNIRGFLINPPKTVDNFINGTFSQSEFNSYFSIKNINIDYQNGSISLDVGLNTYFSPSDGSLIQSIQNELIAHFTFNGFFKSKPTIIKTNSEVEGDLKKQAASIFAQNKSQIIKYIRNHKEQFFENLTTDFNFNNDMVIGPVSYNNEFGTVTFEISISNYFNENGEFINDKNNPLKQEYTLSGFLCLNETEMTQFINIGLENNRIFGPDIGPNSINEISSDDIANGLFNYANGNQTIINTFTNLPPNFTKSNIIVSPKNKWNIDYQKGEIKLEVSLSLYVNEKHEIINATSEAEQKKFSLTIFGFNKIGGPTKVANEISISDPIYGLSNVYSTDFNLDSFNTLLRNNKFLDQLLNPIPGNFNYTIDIDNSNIKIYNSTNISTIPENSPFYGTSISPTEVIVSFKYKNYYVENSNTHKIEISQNWKDGYVKLTGFAPFEKTTVNTSVEWDLQTTSAAYIYPGSVKDNDPQLLQALSKVKNQYIKNQYNSNDGIQTKINSVSKLPTSQKDLENGKLRVRIGIVNYFTTTGPVIGIDHEDYYEITCIGFKKQNITVASKENVVVSISSTTLASNIPSKSYEVANILRILNQPTFIQQIIPPENIVKNNDGTYLTRFSSIVSPKDGIGQQIHVDDSNGTMTISLRVINTYNPDLGTISSNESLLKDSQDKLVKVTITGFRRAKNTTFKNLNNPILNSNMSKTHSQIFYIDQFILDPIRAKEYLAANNINPGSDGVNQSVVNVNNIEIITNSQKDLNNGTITYNFSYSGAYKIDTVENLKKEQLANSQNNQIYNNFDDSSMVLTTTTLTGTFILNGFSIMDEETNNFLFYFSIAAASTIGLILLISLIVILVRRRIR